MSKQKDIKFYDDLRKNEWKNTADFGPGVRTRYRIINKLLNKYNVVGTLNDVGCGSGNLIEYILLHNKSRFESVIGSDFSIEALKIAKQKNPDIKFEEIDLTDVPSKYIEKNQSDLVLCSEVLEHIEDDEIAIQNMFKMLNIGGYVIISVPYLMKHWTQHDDFSGHVRRYEPGELEQKLEKAGFAVVESFGWGNFIYEMYFRILGKTSPKAIMSTGKNKFRKKILAKFLYNIFRVEDFFTRKNHGRRIFAIAMK